MKPTLRKPLLTLHTWLGLTVGVPLLVVALSGTVLIFRSALERKLDPHRFIVAAGATRLPLDELVARAKAAHPGADFLSVRFYGDPTMPFMALFSDKVYVHLNPHTGEFLGARQRYGEGFGWVEGLHKYIRLDPEIGENVNGALAFLFIGLFAAGLVLWWPATRRALKAGLTLNPALKGRPWRLNLHKTFGAYAALLLLFSAATGVPISFDSTRVVLDLITGSKRDLPPKPPAQPAKTFAGFEAVERQIEGLMPGARETYIALPKNGLAVGYAIAADAPHPNARSYVWVDAGTAALVRYAPYAHTSPGYRLYYWLLSLHTAVAGGYLMQFVLMLSTLSVPVLAFTGVSSYLRRRAQHTARGLKPAAAAAAAAAAAVVGR
jgi:vanillate O-demethylase ferredoxin subunit